MPSRPASSSAEKARYGLADGSGQRNSMRLAFGLEPVIGMRTQAERLRWRVDQVDRRLEAGDQAVVGVHRRVGERQQRRGVLEDAADVVARHVREAAVARSRRRTAGSPSFQIDWWTCMPEPLSPKIGFGMKVAVLPLRQATFLTMYLNFITSSAALSSSSNL